MSKEPCPTCGEYPCAGSHADCCASTYAAHRGLTMQQLEHTFRFDQRRAMAEMMRIRKLGSFPT